MPHYGHRPTFPRSTGIFSGTCIFMPGPDKPEKRIAYFKSLGCKDPLRCGCGKFKSEFAPEDWRCTCTNDTK